MVVPDRYDRRFQLTQIVEDHFAVSSERLGIEVDHGDIGPEGRVVFQSSFYFHACVSLFRPPSNRFGATKAHLDSCERIALVIILLSQLAHRLKDFSSFEVG